MTADFAVNISDARPSVYDCKTLRFLGRQCEIPFAYPAVKGHLLLLETVLRSLRPNAGRSFFCACQASRHGNIQ